MPSIWNLSLLGGLVGILILITVSVMRGLFIPYKTHMRELNAERVRSDEWKATAESRSETISSLIAQHNAMLEATRTTDALIPALRNGSSDGGRT
jgi:Tfp pilus assembly protein PilO